LEEAQVIESVIITEDGKVLKEGDRAYDYYNMKPGKIGKLDSLQSGWFDFYHDDGTRCFLNGQRICSVEYAKRRGFKDA
jgi:hypothetical protein